MNKLNKTFIQNQVLTASELNAITGKVDEIITLLSSLDPNDGVTEQDITDRVNAAKELLQALIDRLNSSIAATIVRVKALEDGTHIVDDEEEFLKVLKQQCSAVLIDLQLAKKIIVDGEEVVVSAVDLGVLKTDIDGLKTSFTGLSALEGLVSLIANHFDENGNPIYDGAQIIAAINEEGVSTVGISADKVIISGDVTLTDKLQEINIGKADVDDLDALSATVGNLSADTIKTNVLETLSMNISNNALTIGGGDGYSLIYFDVSGNSTSNNVGVSISNNDGLTVQCDENTSNEIGYIKIGNTNGQFGIFTNHSSGNSTAQSGMGYTGVINGAKFINGICVGTNTI